jgi:nitrile hydratase alpha subunit
MSDQEAIQAGQDAWRKVVLRAWQDKNYKRALLENPNKVLAEAGVPIDPGVNLVVVENEPKRIHLVLPAHPGGTVRPEHANAVALSDYDAAIL